MVALSALLHLSIVLLALLLPQQWWGRPAPPLVSYTVDLIAPDKLGGTNLVEGGQGRVQGQTMAAAEPPPKPREQVRVPEPPAEKKPVPPREAPKAPEAEGVALAMPSPTRVPPTITPTRLAVAVAQVPPTRTPVPREVLEERERQAEAERKKREQQEAERRKQQQEEEAKRRVATAEAQQKAQARATATAAAAEEKKRQEIEQQIVAAAKRLQQQAGERGAGSGEKKGGAPGGPLSVGPGQGAGGQVMGVDYVLYLGQLERKLKENWAWAGTNEALEAVVGFSILPDGKVANVRILKSSGDRSFDLSVERTVRALDPMPPPPEAYRELFGDVQYTFNAKSMKE